MRFDVALCEKKMIVSDQLHVKFTARLNVWVMVGLFVLLLSAKLALQMSLASKQVITDIGLCPFELFDYSLVSSVSCPWLA